MTARSTPDSPDVDDEDLQRVLAGLVAGGFRGSEQHLLATARKRLRTAAWYAREARRYREKALVTGRAESEEFWSFRARVVEIRSAERRCAITRDERRVAIALAPSWHGSTESLLLVAAAVLARDRAPVL